MLDFPRSPISRKIIENEGSLLRAAILVLRVQMGELQGLLWWGGEGEKNRIEISFFPSSEQCFAPQVYLLLIPSLDLVYLKPKPLPIKLGAILMILQNSKGL